MNPLHSGQIIGGRYRLDQPLARGGMGSVWRAYHAQIGTPFAVKFMAKALLDSESARARFEREARATALLRSPFVVQVLDFGAEGDVPYLVMELLVGEDLSQRLKRIRKLSPAQFYPLLVQIAKGLQKAHEAGIVHRDLKPRNVFICDTDEGEVVKILDFGVAKISGELGHTMTGEIVGSPQYVSPEQAKGERNIDFRSDLWSLGAIAYRALTGELAFNGDGVGDILVKIALEKAAPPTSLAPELSREFDRFFEKAFERDPNQRFQSAQQFVRAFGALLGEGDPWSGVNSRRGYLAGSTAGAGDAGPNSYSVTPAPMLTHVTGPKAALAPMPASKRGVVAAAALGVLGVLAGGLAVMLWPKLTPLGGQARGAADSAEVQAASAKTAPPAMASSADAPADAPSASPSALAQAESPPPATASARAAPASKTAPKRTSTPTPAASRAPESPSPPATSENPDLGY